MEKSHPKISVETVGYYHADCEFNATPDLLPKRLNDYKKFFEDPSLPFPFIDVNIPLTSIPTNKEYNLKSLLDYIRQKGWPNEAVPDFVTHRLLLQRVTGNEGMEVYVVRVNGVIFMYRNDERPAIPSSYLCVFRHHLTRKAGDEPVETDGTLRNGVFNASIHMGDGRKRENVLYSGKVDLIDDDDQHKEVRFLTGDLSDWFWEEQSSLFYWQSFFANCTHLLFGMRTGYLYKDPKTRPPFSYPPLSIYKVQKMSLSELYDGANDSLKQFPFKKQIKDGYEDIRGLLSLIREHVRNDGDGFIFSRNDGARDWTVRRDQEAVVDFKECILENIPN